MGEKQNQPFQLSFNTSLNQVDESSLDGESVYRGAA